MFFYVVIYTNFNKWHVTYLYIKFYFSLVDYFLTVSKKSTETSGDPRVSKYTNKRC